MTGKQKKETKVSDLIATPHTPLPQTNEDKPLGQSETSMLT